MWRRYPKQPQSRTTIENKEDNIKISVCFSSSCVCIFLSVNLKQSTHILHTLFLSSCWLLRGVVENKPLYQWTKTVFFVFVTFSHGEVIMGVRLELKAWCYTYRLFTKVVLYMSMWCCGTTKVFWEPWWCKHLFGVVALYYYIYHFLRMGESLWCSD